MTEQPPYSLLVRGIDDDALPVADPFGMVCAAVVVGSPISTTTWRLHG
jgi:hypothetical protein